MANRRSRQRRPVIAVIIPPVLVVLAGERLDQRTDAECDQDARPRNP